VVDVLLLSGGSAPLQRPIVTVPSNDKSIPRRNVLESNHMAEDCLGLGFLLLVYGVG
jgi:hypothetical protein